MSDFIKLTVDCFTKKYFQLKGRASRKEFLSCTFFTILLSGILEYILEVSDSILNNNSFPLKILIFYILIFIDYFFNYFTIVPNVTVAVRRLHDLKMSGWIYFFFICFTFISIICMAIVLFPKRDLPIPVTYIVIGYSLTMLPYLVLIFKAGTLGPNKYGEPPAD